MNSLLQVAPVTADRQAALEQLWAAIKNKEGWRVGYNPELSDATERLRKLDAKVFLDGTWILKKDGA